MIPIRGLRPPVPADPPPMPGRPPRSRRATSRWTPEREWRLAELWMAGVPARVIAEVLGEGASHNAVIGKAHRLQLPRRTNPVETVR